MCKRSSVNNVKTSFNREVFLYEFIPFTRSQHLFNMKTIITAVVLFLSTICFAQSKGSLTLYGFKQVVSGGVPPDRTQLPSNNQKVYKGTNYLLYATASFTFQPVEVWLGGVRYSVRTTNVPTPVVYGDETNIGSPKKTLVPKNGQTVVQLIPIIFKGGKVRYMSAAWRLSKNNELVVIYKQAGKIYFSSLRSLTVLDDGAML